MNDPIADQTRSILDGHIVLSREMTDFGIYPPINILNSASRLISDIAMGEHIMLIQKFRKLYALLKENELLLRIGAYTKGSDSELDEAIDKKENLENFLKQNFNTYLSFENILQELKIALGVPLSSN